MEFFKPTVELGKEVQWTFTFIIDAEGVVKGSCSQRGLGLKSKALTHIHPIRFEGTAEDLDKGLMAALREPVAKVVGLVQNISAHEKTVALAIKKAEEEKTKTTPKPAGKTETKAAVKPPEKDAKTKKFELLMKRVDDLEKDGKPGQALAALPKITDYPEKEAEIKAKTGALRAKRGDLDLFAQTPAVEEPLLTTTTSQQEVTEPPCVGEEGEEPEDPKEPEEEEDQTQTEEDEADQVLTQAHIE